MKQYRVLLVDDHPLIQMGCWMINAQPDMVVVGGAENGEQALQMIRELKPCSVCVGHRPAGFNGIDIAGQDS